MYTLQDFDTDLFCMVMNKVEIMDAVVDELENNWEDYVGEDWDGDWEDIISSACSNLGYSYSDLSYSDVNKIKNRLSDFGEF